MVRDTTEGVTTQPSRCLNVLVSGTLFVLLIGTEGALSIALTRDFHPNPIPHIAFGATSVSDGLFLVNI